MPWLIDAGLIPRMNLSNLQWGEHQSKLSMGKQDVSVTDTLFRCWVRLYTVVAFHCYYVSCSEVHLNSSCLNIAIAFCDNMFIHSA